MKATTNNNVKNMVDLGDYDYKSLCHGCGKFISKCEGGLLGVRTVSR